MESYIVKWNSDFRKFLHSLATQPLGEAEVWLLDNFSGGPQELAQLLRCLLLAGDLDLCLFHPCQSWTDSRCYNPSAREGEMQQWKGKLHRETLPPKIENERETIQC